MSEAAAQQTDNQYALPFQIRLRTAIAEEIEYTGSAQALSRVILSANGGESRFKFDRRKLTRIANNDADVSLSFPEMHALDTYLTRRGKGLKALLE